jgi:FAD/FMN-containing dehydrogenase
MYSAKEKSEKEAAKQAMSMILDEVLSRGGTISGEHGIGLAKLPYLDRQLGGRERQLMQDIKGVFDPLNIMNPGKAF